MSFHYLARHKRFLFAQIEKKLITWFKEHPDEEPFVSVKIFPFRSTMKEKSDAISKKQNSEKILKKVNKIKLIHEFSNSPKIKNKIKQKNDFNRTVLKDNYDFTPATNTPSIESIEIMTEEVEVDHDYEVRCLVEDHEKVTLNSMFTISNQYNTLTQTAILMLPEIKNPIKQLESDEIIISYAQDGHLFADDATFEKTYEMLLDSVPVKCKLGINPIDNVKKPVMVDMSTQTIMSELQMEKFIKDLEKKENEFEVKIESLTIKEIIMNDGRSKIISTTDSHGNEKLVSRFTPEFRETLIRAQSVNNMFRSFENG